MNKFIQITKQLLVAIFISLIVVPSFASNSNVNVMQIVQTKKVSINVKDRSLKDIILDIQKQTDLEFAIKDNTIANIKKNVNIKDVTVETALNTVLNGTGFTYQVIGNIIAIVKSEVKPQDKVVKKFNIKGKVLEKNKNSIAGATVINLTTSKGSISDERGEFILEVVLGDIVEVSFIGKTTVKQTITKQLPEYFFTLQDDALQVEDVIVTGFQHIKQHENAGAVTKIKAEDLSINSTLSVEQLLEGKVAGMVVGNPSGAIGQRQKVRVRGTSSILGNQEPVWVVDGVIQNDPLPFNTQDFNSLADGMSEGTDMIKDFVGNAISWLNPNDIEDITVLKDAASTVLYGIKAANGVIVITTKQGKLNSRASLSYTGGLTYRAPYSYDKLYMMNSKERIDVEREMIEKGRPTLGVIAPFGYEYLYNEYLNKRIDFTTFEREVAKLETNNTDWLGVLTRGTFSHNHTINISGGSDRLTYYSSLNYVENKGEVKNNSSDKYGFNIRVSNWLIKSKLNINMAVRGTYTATNGLAGESPFTYAKNSSRALPAYDDEGERFFYTKSNYRFNMEHETDHRWNKNTVGTVNGSISVDWNIIDRLKFNTGLNFGYSSTVGETVATEQSHYITTKRKFEFGEELPTSLVYKQSVLPSGGELRKSENTNINWSWRTSATYSKIIDKHRIGGMIGFELRSTKYNGFDEILYGYLPDKGRSFAYVPLKVLSNNGDTEVMNTIYNNMSKKVTDRLSNTLGVFLNASYTYDERYVLTASIRSDASNRFGQYSNEAFLPVYSVGVRWNMSSEKWMKDIQHIFSNVAFRGSFGYQGNVAENYGPELIVKYANNNSDLSLFGVNPVQIVSLPYDNLTWEKTESYNAGLDLSLFKSKVQVSFNYYRKKTTDAITQAEIAYEWGMNTMPINDGVIVNSGWDVSLSLTPIRTKDFVWSVSTNYAKNYNNIESKMMQNKSWKNATTGSLVKDGYPISSVWGFKYMGVNGETGIPLIEYKNEESGDFIKEDVTTWMYNLGKLDPDFSGGFSTSFKWKKFTLSASFTMQFGAYRWLAPYLTSSTVSPYSNLRAEAVKRWRKAGDELNPDVLPGLPYKDGWAIQEKSLPVIGKTDDGVTQLSNVSTYELFNKSDVRFVKANFFKCNNLSLSYSLPQKALKLLKLSTLSARASVSNPFRISSKAFKDVDPEVAFGGMPISRTISFSVSIGF